jgi:hypothetical protein
MLLKEGFHKVFFVPRKKLSYLMISFQYGRDGTPFKVSTPARWLVLITNPEVVREINECDKYFSLADSVAEVSRARTRR